MRATTATDVPGKKGHVRFSFFRPTTRAWFTKILTMRLFIIHIDRKITQHRGHKKREEMGKIDGNFRGFRVGKMKAVIIWERRKTRIETDKMASRRRNFGEENQS